MANPFPFASGDVLTAANLNSIGEYTGYTPTFSNISFSSYTARYALVNGLLHVWFSGDLDAAVTGTIQISAPVATKPPSGDTLMSGACYAIDDSTNAQYNGVVLTRSDDQFRMISDIDGTSASAATWDATAPFTWASGDLLSFSLVVEAG
jgi:hypothetical protein